MKKNNHNWKQLLVISQQTFTALDHIKKIINTIEIIEQKIRAHFIINNRLKNNFLKIIKVEKLSTRSPLSQIALKS